MARKKTTNLGVQRSIQLNSQTDEKICKIARAYNIPVSQCIRMALESFYDGRIPLPELLAKSSSKVTPRAGAG